MKCPYCDAELEARSYGKPTRIVMICPKDYVTQHPQTVYVPVMQEPK